MLDLISDFIGAILNALSCLLYAKIVLSKNSNVKKSVLIIFVLIIALVGQFLSYLNITVLKTFIIFVMISFLFKFTYYFDTIKSFMLGFFYFIFQILADMIVIKLFTFLVGEEVFYQVIAGSSISNLIVMIPVLILSFLFRKLVLKALDIKVKYRLIFMAILSFVCIVAVFYETFDFGTTTIDNLLGLFCLLVIVLILCNSFMQTYKNNKLVSEYDKLLEFIKKYEAEIDIQRTMRHETKNQLLIIKSKLVDKDNENNVIEYIDEILDDNNKEIKHSEYAKLRYLPSNGIKGLFYFKVSEAIDRKIKVNINVSKSIEKSFICKLNSTMFNQLGKILGIFLDNAIEGSEISDKKQIGIEVYSENDNIIFVISNTYVGNISSKNGSIPRSTKGINRGHGLLLVRSLVNSNSKFINETEVTDKLYVQKLIVKK